MRKCFWCSLRQKQTLHKNQIFYGPLIRIIDIWRWEGQKPEEGPSRFLSHVVQTLNTLLQYTPDGILILERREILLEVFNVLGSCDQCFNHGAQRLNTGNPNPGPNVTSLINRIVVEAIMQGIEKRQDGIDS